MSVSTETDSPNSPILNDHHPQGRYSALSRLFVMGTKRTDLLLLQYFTSSIAISLSRPRSASPCINRLSRDPPNKISTNIIPIYASPARRKCPNTRANSTSCNQLDVMVNLLEASTTLNPHAISISLLRRLDRRWNVLLRCATLRRRRLRE